MKSRKRYTILLLSGAASMLVASCTQKDYSQIPLPANVFSLYNEVFSIRTASDMKKDLLDISLGPLKNDSVKQVGEVFLAEYMETEVSPVEFTRKGDNIIALLKPDATYLVGLVPKGQLRSIYTVFCILNRHRIYIEKIEPSIFSGICSYILCGDRIIPADSLATVYAGFEKVSRGMDFGDLTIGGMGRSAGICDKCPGLNKGALIFPTLTCWKGELPTMQGCGQIVFKDDFEADAIDSAPSTSPPGNPVDDQLTLTAGIMVRYSAVLSSNVVQISRGSSSDVILGCVTGGSPNNAGKYEISFKGYSGEIAFSPAMTIVLTSSGGAFAFRLAVQGGQYKLTSGSGTETLTATYSINTPDSFVFTLDLSSSQFSLSINGTLVATNRSFLDNTFADVKMLSFRYPAAILEAFGSYSVDDVLICKTTN